MKIFVCNRPPHPVRLTGGALEKCRGRPLPKIFHLFADTACRKLRAAGKLRNCASPHPPPGCRHFPGLGKARRRS